jgi:16S rRNA (cytosine1402-N4)-methyltransferase
MNAVMTASYHQPVLVAESLRWLAPAQARVVVDSTYGGGGHAQAILEALPPTGRLLALDQDADSRAQRLADSRLQLLAYNFRYLQAAIAEAGWTQVDGLLADLGISSHQIDEPERGFSYRHPAPLDMRMDQAQALTAATVVNTYPQEELARIFYEYAELRGSRKLAARVAQVRARQALTTTQALVDAVADFAPAHQRNKFLSQLFQGLRIEVNDELGALRALLAQAVQVLRPGGRLVVISYHSLEDRLVKRFLQHGNFAGQALKDFYGNPLTPWRPLTRKPVQPTEAEIARNPRARSARLRAAERNEQVYSSEALNPTQQ